MYDDIIVANLKRSGWNPGPKKERKPIDTCEYCGVKYHPMPVWAHEEKYGRIYVHHIRWVEDDNGDLIIYEDRGCEAKAIADGYVKRMDLTPKR